MSNLAIKGGTPDFVTQELSNNNPYFRLYTSEISKKPVLPMAS